MKNSHIRTSVLSLSIIKQTFGYVNRFPIKIFYLIISPINIPYMNFSNFFEKRRTAMNDIRNRFTFSRILCFQYNICKIEVQEKEGDAPFSCNRSAQTVTFPSPPAYSLHCTLNLRIASVSFFASSSSLPVASFNSFKALT